MSESESDFIEDPNALPEMTPQLQHYLKQVASGHAANNFGRRFAGLELARKIVGRGEPHWFCDLLSLWRPSGCDSGSDGLRLAVRNGYLNFYRRGQSVARVSAARGALRAHVHVKYFSAGAASGEALGQDYGILAHTEVATRGGVSAPYAGVETLRSWITVIDQHYAGAEKRLVDELVARNANVIDLEMALPAWGAQRTAPRMDLVAIEDQQVIFWEAKTVTDGRIRCRAPFEIDKKPEVLRQLAQYRIFLEQDRHVELVEEAYRSAAAITVELRKLADQCAKPLPLGAQIVQASQAAKLTVAPCAALVVLDHADDKGRAWRSWRDGGHEAKLKGRLPMLVQQVPGALSYGDAH